MKKNFKELSLQDKDFISSVYFSNISHNEKIEILSSKFNVVGRTVRNWWLALDLKSQDSKLPKQLLTARERALPEDVDMLFITACQNKTLINKELLDYMLSYKDTCESKGHKVAIVIIPSRYRNPVSREGVRKYYPEEWWVDEVEPYLYYSKIEFGDCLISADSRVRPTAAMPLTGYECMASENHFVIGHPRVHSKTLPRFKGDPLRVMCTTGFLSRKNYSVSKAGDKGQVHHSYGFVVVEKREDGTCHPPRNVKANNDGTFTDIIYEVNEGGVKEVDYAEGLVWGDLHAREIDVKKMSATLALSKKLNVKNTVLQDVYDGSTVNPHEKDDLFIRKLKIKRGLHLIEEEVRECLEVIENIKSSEGTGQLYVIQANHDDFLDRHINNMNWKRDLHNSEAYLKLAYIQQTCDLTKFGNIFGCIINDHFKGEVPYIKNGESLRLMSYQCGFHGDHGINGARGSITSFKRLNTKMIHGHTHSPAIIDGVTCVGVSCNLWQYYNSNGMSSWALADAIVHKNGKNQLIIYGDDYTFTNLI